ncbi:MAG: hypothetical protein ACXABG_13865, partial [Promethearchaeota archaeon]
MSWAILKDSISVYKESDIRVFTRAGLITSIFLIIFFGLIQFLNISFGAYSLAKDSINVIIDLLLAFLSALFTSSMFWIIGKKYGPKIGNLLVTNKIAKIVLTKGDAHYFEKLGDSERKVIPGVAINKFINLLLTWLAVTAFLIGIFLPLLGSLLTPGENSEQSILRFLTANFDDPLYYVIKLIFVLLLTPILLNIVIPIPWMLIDTQLKSYSSGPGINHM